MNKRTKIALYVLLALSACLFIWRFQSNYARLMKEGETKTDTDLVNIKVPDYQRMAAPAKTDYHLGGWGAGMVLSLVGLGLMVAHDISGLVGGRALKVIYNDEGEGMANPDYEKAEEEWANGNFLEAIQLMRDYLKLHPREQYVALRIAEIYEKDLGNHLAAALEYEEILKTRLSADRWGRAAIHLANLYSGKLNRPDDATALLRRIINEYPQTPAAKKAREHLAEPEPAAIVQQPEAPAEAPRNLPPGFRPK